MTTMIEQKVLGIVSQDSQICEIRKDTEGQYFIRRISGWADIGPYTKEDLDRLYAEWN